MHRIGLLLPLAASIALVGCSKTTTERLQLPPLRDGSPGGDSSATSAPGTRSRAIRNASRKGARARRRHTRCAATARSTCSTSAAKTASMAPKMSQREGRASWIVRPAPSSKCRSSACSGATTGSSISGTEYEYAVVGHPSRDYLWILSRTPTLDDNAYDNILSRLEEKGYPLDPLRKTQQPTGP